MKYTIRTRIIRDDRTIQLTTYEEQSLAKVTAKYRALERRLLDIFYFRIETIDDSVTWIGRGSRDSQKKNEP